MFACPTRYVFVTIARYLVFVKNDEIPALSIENGFLYNKVCIEPIEILKGNHYNGFKAILVSSDVRNFVVLDLKVEVPMNLISITPFHNVVTTNSIPLDPKGDLPEPPKGDIITYVQPIIPYSSPFERSLNYLMYKKNSNLNAHVRIFKAVIKANNETILDEIINMFNFTLKDNTSY
jgi:hypothetical protein